MSARAASNRDAIAPVLYSEATVHHRDPVTQGDTPMGYGIVGLIILVLDIIAIIDVVQSNKEVAVKLLWILLILLLPLLGMILYFILGR